MKTTPVAYGYLWCAVASVFSATATLLLKKSAAHGGGFTDLVRLAWLGGAAGSYVLGFFCYGQALGRLDMTVAYPVMTAFTMVAVAGFGMQFLGETLSLSKMAAMLMLCVACWLMTK